MWPAEGAASHEARHRFSGKGGADDGWLTVNSERTPAVRTMDRAAAKGPEYMPACTLRTHTARGTFTTLLPAAAAAPATNATEPAQRALRVSNQEPPMRAACARLACDGGPS